MSLQSYTDNCYLVRHLHKAVAKVQYNGSLLFFAQKEGSWCHRLLREQHCLCSALEVNSCHLFSGGQLKAEQLVFRIGVEKVTLRTQAAQG